MQKTTLIIVAHPDDAELAMGMRILHHTQNGDFVCICCLSKGQGKLKKLRENEARLAGTILDVDQYVFFNIPDLSFIDKRTQIQIALYPLIHEFKPDIIYTHFPNDQHKDHQVTSEEVLTLAEREVPNIFYFQSPYSKDFRPNFFYLAGEDAMEKKCTALNAFASQPQFNAELIRNFNEILFQQYIHHTVLKQLIPNKKEKKYAELFHIVRTICLDETSK